MDEATQKMEGLKKAYAEIILNTTKEAAGKIMVAERKAYRYHKQMLEAKEEALNILVRFKTMADSKFAEMEMLSLSQKKKISELEAQLHKSEGVANGLSSELKEVKEELRKIKDSIVQPLNKITANNIAASNEDVSQDNQHVASGWSRYYPLDSDCVLLSSLKRNDTSLHQLHMTYSSEAGKESKRIASQSSFPEEKFSADNPDIPSIMRSIKKPQLYRPGCTQRIHALERKQLNKKFPSPEDTNIKSFRKKNKIGKTGVRKKNSSSSGGLLEKCHSFNRVQDASFFRVPCRKSGTRFRKPRSAICTNLIMKPPAETTPSHGETCPCPDMNITKSCEEPDNRAPDCTSTPLSSFRKTHKDTKLECADDVQTDAVSGDNLLKEESDHLTTQENQDADYSEIPESILNLKKDEIPLTSSDTKDNDISEMNAGAPADNKFLKFTFRRKRKKASSSNRDECTSLENNILKKRACEMQRTGLEQPKSNLTVESTRDDGMLMLVARQLISLKDKKCWK